MKEAIRRFREKLEAQIPCVGIYISTPGALMVETAAMAGYDFIRIDCEHGLLGRNEVRELIRIANLLELPVFVRVPGTEEIGAILDAGADGVVVPDIRTPEDAQAAVNAAKYAPEGKRGLISTMRNMKYGRISSADYVKTANSGIFLCIQIEEKEAVERLDEILSVPGIDMVATGKQDLSQSYGCPGDTLHPLVQAAQDLVIQKSVEHGKIPTILVPNRRKMEELMRAGVTCFIAGFDTVILRKAFTARREEYR